MASTTEDGAFEANFPDNKLTLFLTQVGGRVLRVIFHDTSSWCHETSWICTLIPDKYSPHINHHKFRQRLSALKEQLATHGRLTSIQFDRWMFVFGHETEDIADAMLGRYTSLKEIILKFIHEFDARVTDITMKSESMRVDAAAARKYQGSVTYTGMTGNSKAEDSLVAGQVNTGNITLYLCESPGKAAYRTSWKTANDIPQRPFVDFESLATRLKQMFNAILVRVRRGCMVFCFEHESKEDAINMIIRHAEVKEVILHFLKELDPSIQDIRMKVEFRKLCQPEEQTADTSETRPVGMADPEHKDEEGTPRSHPQQKDDDETCYPHIQDKDDSHLHPQKMYVKDTSYSHPLTTYEMVMFAYPPTGIKKGPGSHSSGYSSGSHSSRYSTGSHSSRYSTGSHSSRYSSGLHSSRYSSGSHSSRYSSGSHSSRYSSGSHSSRSGSGSHSSGYTTSSRADTDLFFASREGNLEEVKRLLSTAGVDVDCRVGGWTPLLGAAWRGHRDVVELLLSEGADVSLVDMAGDNILHFACWAGDVETVKYVLSLNVVDIDARNNIGQTAADVARQCRRQPVVELLVSRGAQ